MSKVHLTYDDIQLVPSYSEVSSRKNISLKTMVSNKYFLDVPIVASPMDTVCEYEMASKLMSLGGVGCIHRFMGIQEQKNIVLKLTQNKSLLPIMAAVGANGDYLERAVELITAGVNIILIDVAHGHHKNVKDAIKKIKGLDPVIDVIAGNIATAEAAEDLQEWGADGLRVGIGGGCFTPNMEVKTNNGFVKIKDIKIGDYVFTHTGELKPVINKFEYNDYEEIYIINDIETTYNHKFYVVHNSKANLIDNENIHQYGEWVAAKDLSDEYFLIEL